MLGLRWKRICASHLRLQKTQFPIPAVAIELLNRKSDDERKLVDNDLNCFYRRSIAVAMKLCNW